MLPITRYHEPLRDCKAERMIPHQPKTIEVYSARITAARCTFADVCKKGPSAWTEHSEGIAGWIHLGTPPWSVRLSIRIPAVPTSP